MLGKHKQLLQIHLFMRNLSMGGLNTAKMLLYTWNIALYALIAGQFIYVQMYTNKCACH